MHRLMKTCTPTTVISARCQVSRLLLPGARLALVYPSIWFSRCYQAGKMKEFQRSSAFDKISTKIRNTIHWLWLPNSFYLLILLYSIIIIIQQYNPMFLKLNKVVKNIHFGSLESNFFEKWLGKKLYKTLIFGCKP